MHDRQMRQPLRQVAKERTGRGVRHLGIYPYAMIERGEYLAQRPVGEVLLTEGAFARVGNGKRSFETKHAKMGRLRFAYHRDKRVLGARSKTQ